MAIVRTRQAPGCAHGIGCPHDIGAAAAGIDGLSALGRLSALRVPGLEGGAVAVGMGPITRRPATPAELARLDPPPVAMPVRKGPSIHLVRPASRSAQQPPATTRTVAATPPAARTEAPSTPAPSPKEEPVSIVAAPPAIPCGDCLHEPVCALKASLGEEPLNAEPHYFAPGLRAIRAVLRIECDHQLTSLRQVEPEPIRAEHGGESWRTNGAEATSIGTVRVASIDELNAKPAAAPKRFPLPRDRAERDRVVLDAIRTTDRLSEAAHKLGVSENRVSQILTEIRAMGAMPEDVAQLLAARGSKPKAAAS